MTKKKKTTEKVLAPDQEVMESWLFVRDTAEKLTGILTDEVLKRPEKRRVLLMGRVTLLMYQKFFHMGISAAEQSLQRTDAQKTHDIT